jgi:hypothetical protein
MKSHTSRRVKELLLPTTILTATLVAAGASVAALLGAGTANATSSQDSSWAACVGEQGIYNTTPGEGRSFSNDLAWGIRSGPQEDRYVYLITGNSISQSDANVMVNCATEVYSGYGPDSSWYDA